MAKEATAAASSQAADDSRTTAAANEDSAATTPPLAEAADNSNQLNGTTAPATASKEEHKEEIGEQGNAPTTVNHEGESNGNAAAVVVQAENEEGAIVETAMSALASFAGVAENAAPAALTEEVAAMVPPVAASSTPMPPFPGNAFLPFPSAPPVSIAPGELQWEQLVAGSSLVFLTDRNLVPDSLFVAMAQMEPCKLSELDRCGAYKNREIGYVSLENWDI